MSQHFYSAVGLKTVKFSRSNPESSCSFQIDITLLGEQTLPKLLQLLFISLLWFLIGWFSSYLFQSINDSAIKPSIEQQRIVTAYQLLQSRQLLLNHPSTNSSLINAASSSQRANAAISGMLAWSQDIYADLYGPLATERYLADYREGIGVTDIQFKIKNGQRIVTELSSDSPAGLAGVEVGDILLVVDGFEVSQSVGGYEIATLLRGPVGSTYELTFQRGNQVMTRTVVRKKWEYLSHQIMEDNIGYLKTEYFVAGHMEDAIRTIVTELVEADVRALIWDLRNSSGGSPTVAEEVVGYFQKAGTLFYTAEFNDGTQRNFTIAGDGVLANIPIVVLIDEQTWSASEMVAAAMANRESTVLLGSTTAGKGVIQDTVMLDEKHMLHFTVAKWLTPTGSWIHAEGVHPDVAVEDDETTIQDEVLEMAIHSLTQLLTLKQ